MKGSQLYSMLRHIHSRLLCICLLITILLSFHPSAHAQLLSLPSNVYPALWQLAAERPHAKIPVIIQKTTNNKVVEALVAHYGGTVTRDLPMIRSLAVDLPASVLAVLASDPSVRFISLDAPVRQAGGPVDSSRLVSSYIRTVGADRVWNESPHLQGTGITVAVLDSGIADWADFKQTNGVTSRIQGWAHFSNDGNRSYDDHFGHGSHVAGIIGGNGALSIGEYIGIAPKVSLLNVKVSNTVGASRTSDVVAGMQWILENKAQYNIRVVNISLNSTIVESYHTSPLAAAAEMLWFNGIVVVVSAGNNGNGLTPVDVRAPANDPFVITVGATDDRGTADLGDDVLAPFSAFGVTLEGHAKPDLVAPGRNIISLIGSPTAHLMVRYPGNLVTSSDQTIPYYFRMSGTSMAAPVVTGAVALLLQNEPHLNPDQVKYRLKATARPFSGPAPGSTGSGYLDIYAAVHGTTTESANTGIPMSLMLSSATGLTIWNSVNWNSINWNSINWNSSDESIEQKMIGD